MDVPNLTDITLEPLDLGAQLRAEKCAFKVWAPKAQQVLLRLNGQDHGMRRSGEGYFETEERASAGDHYFYILDGQKPVPDPVSRVLPEGVHGATEIVDPESFQWTDQHWRGIPYAEAIFYELHIATLTAEGTFEAAIAKLPYLKRLGVSMIEIMTVCAFPGTRNWGYVRGVPYSRQASY